MRHSYLLTKLAFAGLLLGPSAAQNCNIASVASFDVSPANPIQLSTTQPGEYMVPGFATHFRANNPGGFAPSYLFLSCSRLGSPTGLPQITGQLLIDPGCLLAPLQSTSAAATWIVGVPNNLGLHGGRVVAQSLHPISSSGSFSFSNGVEFRIGNILPNVGVLSVTPPGALISGVGSPPYRVALRNHGSGPVTIPLRVDVGPSSGLANVLVPPQQTVVADVAVPTPSIGFSCGGSQSFGVTASVPPGCAPANSSATATVSVAAAFWDLVFNVVRVPSSVCRGSSTTWQVEVTNRGNQTSPSSCGISGIGLFPGAGNWNQNLGLNQFGIPPLSPGQSWTHSVGSYFVPCNAALQTQYIKAEIHYANRCSDPCNSGSNNYAESPVAIVFCGC